MIINAEPKSEKLTKNGGQGPKRIKLIDLNKQNQ